MSALTMALLLASTVLAAAQPTATEPRRSVTLAAGPPVPLPATATARRRSAMPAAGPLARPQRRDADHEQHPRRTTTMTRFLISAAVFAILTTPAAAQSSGPTL